MEKISWRLERLLSRCVIPAAGYSPAPLTGDVGRGCGDASRALLLFKKAKTSYESRPSIAG
jgi:hypothetical protein